MPKDEETTQQFEGFSSPNYTPVPDELFDQLMPDLSDPELRIVLYIIRRTYGFKRQQDNISLSQMVNGITTGDGRVLDRGTGLSKATVARTLKALRLKGIIKATRNRSTEKGNEPTTYRLRSKGEKVDDDEKESANTPLVSPVRLAPLSRQRDTPLSHLRDIQETGLQNTDISKFRMAHAQKSRDGAGETETVSNPRIPDHSISEPISDGEGTGSAPRADVGAAAAPNGSPGHLVPLSSQTAVTADSMAPGDRSPTRSRQEGGFRPLAELLPTPPRGRPPGSRDDRDLVTAYLKDFRMFLGDEAPIWSSVSRAINIFKAARIPRERWADLLVEANSITKSSTQHIQKRPGESSNGFAAKNRAPYYFAVLEDLCGLREQSDSAGSSTS